MQEISQGDGKSYKERDANLLGSPGGFAKLQERIQAEGS